MFADQIIKQNTCSMIFFFPWKLPVKEYEINLNKHLQDFNMNMVILRRKLYKTLQDKLQRLVQIQKMLWSCIKVETVSVLNLHMYVGYKSCPVPNSHFYGKEQRLSFYKSYFTRWVSGQKRLFIGCLLTIFTHTGTAHRRKRVKAHQTFSGPRKLVRKSL